MQIEHQLKKITQYAAESTYPGNDVDIINIFESSCFHITCRLEHQCWCNSMDMSDIV